MRPPDVSLPEAANRLPADSGDTMDPAADRDFTAFYDATWRRTVAVAYAMTGDLPAAEDLAQEAYSRAGPRWSSLRAYDDPGAWVRQVTSRLAVSRWRRTKTALNHLSRSRHHLGELPVAEVARIEGCPEGTIKARLSRGRAALAELLGEPTPPASTSSDSENSESGAPSHA